MFTSNVSSSSSSKVRTLPKDRASCKGKRLFPHFHELEFTFYFFEACLKVFRPELVPLKRLSPEEPCAEFGQYVKLLCATQPPV